MNRREDDSENLVCTQPYRIIDSARRMADTKARRVQDTNTNRPDQLTAKTAATIHAMMDHCLLRFTGSSSLPLLLSTSTRPLDSIVRHCAFSQFPLN